MVSTSVRNLQRRHSSSERAKEWIRRPPAAIHPNCIWSLPYLPRTLDPKYMCRGANEQSASRTALSPGQTAPNRRGCLPRVPPYRPLPPRRSGRALWWCFGGDPGGHWPGLNSAHTFGRVAQRDRASAFEAEGCRFEPCRGQQRSAYGALHLDEPTVLDWRLYVWSGARRQTPWVRASTALKASSRETNGPSGISPMM